MSSVITPHFAVRKHLTPVQGQHPAGDGGDSAERSRKLEFTRESTKRRELHTERTPEICREVPSSIPQRTDWFMDVGNYLGPGEGTSGGFKGNSAQHPRGSEIVVPTNHSGKKKPHNLQDIGGSTQLILTQ